ncbi:MAG: 3-hydroxyacyl-ACP dehydratase FabZ family protein [Planctomycetota bacterium]
MLLGREADLKFHLIDRITGIVPNESIEAMRSVTLAEEYLADHFPTNPVLPGVMMLEALIQAAAWLIRTSTDFDKSMVLLKEARNVKYGRFVRPGDTLVIRADRVEENGNTVTFKARGEVNGEAAVSARFVMEQFNLADRDPSLAENDETVRRTMRAMLRTLASPEVLAAAGYTTCPQSG